MINLSRLRKVKEKEHWRFSIEKVLQHRANPKVVGQAELLGEERLPLLAHPSEPQGKQSAHMWPR
jgi:hypothetical protein